MKINFNTLHAGFRRRHFEIFFLFFPWKQDLTFHANCFQWKCQILFSEEKNKKNITNLVSAELVQRLILKFTGGV